MRHRARSRGLRDYRDQHLPLKRAPPYRRVGALFHRRTARTALRGRHADHPRAGSGSLPDAASDFYTSVSSHRVRPDYPADTEFGCCRSLSCDVRVRRTVSTGLGGKSHGKPYVQPACAHHQAEEGSLILDVQVSARHDHGAPHAPPAASVARPRWLPPVLPGSGPFFLCRATPAALRPGIVRVPVANHCLHRRRLLHFWQQRPGTS